MRQSEAELLLGGNRFSRFRGTADSYGPDSTIILHLRRLECAILSARVEPSERAANGEPHFTNVLDSDSGIIELERQYIVRIVSSR